MKNTNSNFPFFQCLYAINTPTRLFPHIQLIPGIPANIPVIPGYSWAYKYSCGAARETSRIRRKDEENHQFLVLWVWFTFYIFEAVYGINGE